MTTKEGRSVILIKALNDVGKTSLFKAFQWCLYGAKSRKENQMHVNRSACIKGDGRTSVRLIFSHDGRNYEIVRSIDFHKAPRGVFPEIGDEVLEVIEDGIPVELKTKTEQNEYVEAILPYDASQFFFFDGEDIQKYTQFRPGERVKEAIEMVLGIRELLNARDDLENIKQELEHELDSLLVAKSRHEQEAREVERLGKEIESMRRTIRDLENKIKQAMENVASCDEILRRDRAIQQKVEQRKEAEKNRESILEQIKANEDEQRNFNGDLAFLLMAPLLKELSKAGMAQVPTWKKAALSALLLSGSDRCICERPIDSDIRALFERLLNKGHGAGHLQYLGSQADELLIQKPPEYLEQRLYDIAADRRNLESSLKLYEQIIEELDREIGRRKDISADIKAAEETRKRAAEDLERYKGERERKAGELNFLTAEYKKRQAKLTAQASTDKDVLNKNKHLRSCELCLAGIKYAIEKLVQNNKLKVAELASKIFLQLTNAPALYDGIEITDEYEIKIRTKGGTVRHVWEQVPSAGQSQIIAISFIAALNAYTAREAPVIIDTPIGRLDPIHKKNLIRFYPQIGPQVVILYQPSEMSESDIVPIRRYISSEWELKRDPDDPDATLIVPIKGP
jgi:DNA sulfur modification protein DndD